MKLTKSTFFLGCLGAGALPLLVTYFQTPARADTKLLPFQGRLTDAAGTAIADGAKVVEFKMYDAPTGGTVKWAGEVHKLSINGGLVNTMLGSKASLGSVDFSTPCYLQITVDANTDNQITAADPPLLPRQSVIGSVYAAVAGGIQYKTGLGTVASGGWEKVFSGGDPDTGKINGAKLDGGSVGLPALSAEAIATLGNSGSLTQGSLVPSMTAQEAIGDRKAVAITKDASNNVRLLLANSAVGSRSAFYGFAKGASAIGAPVTIHQFGALNGFPPLTPGSSYYVGTANGEITSIYPTGNPIYVGYSLAADTLFVDPFGVTRKWSNQNYWGSGADGTLSTTGNVSLASIVDGDVVVKQYTSLTINEGDTMTVANRCRGLVIYVDGNCTINGTLSMTARGAKVDPAQSNSIAPTGLRLVRRKAGASETLAASDLGGSGVGGVGVDWRNVEQLQPGISNNGKIYIISRQGGLGGAGFSDSLHGFKNDGGKLDMGSGGGGSGAAGVSYTYAGAGSAGTCYSGGSGGGGAPAGNTSVTATDGGSFGGLGGNGGGVGGPTWIGGAGGGGAGNVAGSAGTAPSQSNGHQADAGQIGTGGTLIIFVRGNLVVGNNGRITTNGSAGGRGGFFNGGGQSGGGGGSSGGGRLVLLHAGTINSAGLIEATGPPGVGVNGGIDYRGGKGGDGSVTIEQIAP